MVLGEEEETELWSEIIDGGSIDEVSEKAGEVKGVSTGRLRAGRVKMGVNCRGQSIEAAEMDSRRDEGDLVQEVRGRSLEMEE